MFILKTRDHEKSLEKKFTEFPFNLFSDRFPTKEFKLRSKTALSHILKQFSEMTLIKSGDQILNKVSECESESDSVSKSE